MDMFLDVVDGSGHNLIFFNTVENCAIMQLLGATSFISFLCAPQIQEMKINT